MAETDTWGDKMYDDDLDVDRELSTIEDRYVALTDSENFNLARDEKKMRLMWASIVALREKKKNPRRLNPRDISDPGLKSHFNRSVGDRAYPYQLQDGTEILYWPTLGEVGVGGGGGESRIVWLFKKRRVPNETPHLIDLAVAAMQDDIEQAKANRG